MTYFHVIAIFALLLLAALMFLVLAEPGLDYYVTPIPYNLDSHVKKVGSSRCRLLTDSQR